MMVSGVLRMARSTRPELDILDAKWNGLQDSFVVLVRLPRGDEQWQGQEFVTWMMNPEDGATYWGHYHLLEEDAREDFKERE